LHSCRSEDQGAPGVFTHRERLVECPGNGDKVWGVGPCRSGLVGDREGDCPTWVAGGREAEREETIRVAKHVSGDSREGGGDSGSVRVRGGGLARSKETTLGTREGRGPLFNSRGRHARNLLEGRRLPSFVLALAAQSGS